MCVASSALKNDRPTSLFHLLLCPLAKSEVSGGKRINICFYHNFPCENITVLLSVGNRCWLKPSSVHAVDLAILVDDSFSGDLTSQWQVNSAMQRFLHVTHNNLELQPAKAASFCNIIYSGILSPCHITWHNHKVISSPLPSPICMKNKRNLTFKGMVLWNS